jgi:MobA-like NTP transferase domain/Molybdopterin oxidoreductase
LPDIGRVRKLLTKEDLFVIIQDIFMSETAEIADVVLPAAAWGEKTGCFTVADRTVHILAGGLSERMGCSKALLQYKGKPLYRRAFDLLSPVCSDVYVSARIGQDFDVPTIYDDVF